MKASSLVACVILVLVCSPIVKGWTMNVPVEPENPRMCHDVLTEKNYKLGESWHRPGHCERLTCGNGHIEGFLTIQGQRCSRATEVPDNCHMSAEKVDIPYPMCCPEIECDGEPNGPVSMVL